MGILDWLFGGNDAATGAQVDQAIIDQRIEQVVTMVDPRLKLVEGYQRKLSKPVVEGILYCRELEAQVPDAIPMSAAGWCDSPVLRALFATAQDIPAVFSRSVDVQSFFAGSPDAQEVCAGLRFVRQEEQRFGVRVQGDVLQQDIAQTAVSFGEKRVVLVAESAQDMRIQIRRRGFKFLVTEALEQIASVHTRRQDLTEQRSMLQARLAILRRHQVGLESMLDQGTGGHEKIEEVAHKLAEYERSLAQFPNAGETLDYVLKRVKAVLTHGPDYIQIHPVRLRLDQMNLVVPADSPDPATEIVLPEVLVKGKPRLHVLVGRFPRGELIPRGNLISEAQRMLG
jgi:hypothetical protein